MSSQNRRKLLKIVPSRANRQRKRGVPPGLFSRPLFSELCCHNGLEEHTGSQESGRFLPAGRISKGSGANYQLTPRWFAATIASSENLDDTSVCTRYCHPLLSIRTRLGLCSTDDHQPSGAAAGQPGQPGAATEASGHGLLWKRPKLEHP